MLTGDGLRSFPLFQHVTGQLQVVIDAGEALYIAPHWYPSAPHPSHLPHRPLLDPFLLLYDVEVGLSCKIHFPLLHLLLMSTPHFRVWQVASC